MESKSKHDFQLDFVCPGGNKCGTTWLSEMLRQHPELNVSLNKEPHYFSSNYKKGREWYRNNWAEGPGLKGEFSTSYIYSEEALNRLKADYPDVRIIVNLRNPLDRSVSHFRHILRSEKETEPEMFLKEHPEIIFNSMYASRIRHLKKEFDEEQLHIVCFDQIKDNPEKLLQEVFVFLQVGNFYPKGIDKVIGKGFEAKHKGLDKLRSSVYFGLKRAGFYAIISGVKRTGIADTFKKFNTKRRDEVNSDCSSIMKSYIPGFINDLQELVLLVPEKKGYISAWISQLKATQNQQND